MANTVFLPTPFSVEKANVLKAILLLGIIMHHLSFCLPPSVVDDFRFTGPYIVGIFFFMSGYGLEHQYTKKKINAKGLLNRLKKIYIPFVLPAIIYFFLALTIEQKTVYILFKECFKNGQLLLPYTWFITIIIAMYLCFYFTRCKFRTNNTYLLFLFVLFSVFMLLVIGKDNSHVYTSNYAFILGIAMKQKEQKWLEFSSKPLFYIFSLCLFTFISVSYILQKPLFKGFAILGVMLYVLSFMCLFTKCSVPKNNKTIAFFSHISYEMYLFQSIAILLIAQLKFSSIALIVLSVVILNILLAFVSHKITRKILSLWHIK